jgi:hypothetical protein
VFVLRDMLEVNYRNVDHPHGDPNKVFWFGVECDEMSYDCQVSITPDVFGMSCGAPIRIPPAQRVRVAEYVTRVNFNVGVGHLSLDFSDGEVRFRVTQQVLPGLADEPLLIANFVEVALHSMKVHFPLVFGVAFGGTSPEQAARTYASAAAP